VPLERLVGDRVDRDLRPLSELDVRDVRLVDFDFGLDNIYDATYFGPLTASTNQITIPANLFVSPLWDLNTPNAPFFYDLQGLAFGPGMHSQNGTISEVRVTPDLKHARVFVSVMGTEAEQKSTIRGLAAAVGYIRHELTERIQLRRAPEIHFTLDHSEEYSQRIEELLRQTRKPAS